MPSALIHYFTGTGNTARVVNLVAERLKEAGYQVKLHRVEHDTLLPGESGERHDLQVFAFPVYAFAAPPMMLRYLRHLREGGSTDTAIIAVHGQANLQKSGYGWEGQALEHVRRILRRRKFNVFFTGAVGYPASFTQFFQPPSPEEEQVMIPRVEGMVQEMIEHILARRSVRKRCNILNQLWSRIITYAFILFGRRFLGKVYIADQNCTACGKCVRACPGGVIKMIGQRPHWKMNCQDCQRCINMCPREAIQTSYFRIVALLIALSIPVPNWLISLCHLGPVASLPVVGGVFSLLAWVLTWFGVLYLTEWVIFLLEFLPPVRWLANLTFTRRFRRYLEPHFQPCERPRASRTKSSDTISS